MRGALWVCWLLEVLPKKNLADVAASSDSWWLSVGEQQRASLLCDCCKARSVKGAQNLNPQALNALIASKLHENSKTRQKRLPSSPGYTLKSKLSVKTFRSKLRHPNP